MFKIEGNEIGDNAAPYVIAELSGNHNGSIERAKLLIKTAKDCGVHAIKIQTYTPDTMTIDCSNEDFIVRGGLWNGYKLYDLYSEAHTPYEWHDELFSYARQLGITLFSTPFDESAVDLLDKIGVPAYKIASFEFTDLPLIRYVAKKGKPLLMSTGMATQDEISETLEAARSGGCNNLLLFHCVSSYPAPIEQANIKQILNLKKIFGVSVGLSDHTIGNAAAISAVALGACAIEKHFTLSRSHKGPDSDFSMEPDDLRALVRDTRDAWASLGCEGFERPSSEVGSKVFKRSIYFVSDLKAGDRIGVGDIRRIRPGFGLPPKYFEELVGKTLVKNVNRGQPVTWDLLSEL
ncbi:pseudaminic acid synthase [Polynucleobacter sp. AM-7D1]|uniref:pseudaminic acid synthase n=1 Tax=Polynucleobacter sp. AM-7D1 TaxID=2689102 RepID=UPI001BFE5487|nr:pseudaminic acid synthase [Polynucleobacter sp. AM-7D1]QWE28991.1 pseudaminic acid synthase [Polynucleobacter sp. AM-7D1]